MAGEADGTGRVIARLSALAVLDVVVVGLGGIAGAPPGWLLGAHALLSASGYAMWLRGGRPIGFSTAMLGIFGPALVLVTLPFGRRSPKRKMVEDDAVFGAQDRSAAQRGAGLAVARMLDGRVHHAPAETLGSLVTVMRHGDISARRRALETVVRSFEPSLSPLIALALTDGDQTIRALAAAASARVAHNLALARECTRDGDPAELAALLADHARADVLLSDSQRTHLREDAVALVPASDVAHDAMAIEALWAAGDYSAIDRLAGPVASADQGRREAVTMAAWWRTEVTA